MQHPNIQFCYHVFNNRLSKKTIKSRSVFVGVRGVRGVCGVWCAWCAKLSDPQQYVLAFRS